MCLSCVCCGVNPVRPCWMQLYLSSSKVERKISYRCKTRWLVDCWCELVRCTWVSVIALFSFAFFTVTSTVAWHLNLHYFNHINMFFHQGSLVFKWLFASVYLNAFHLFLMQKEWSCQTKCKDWLIINFIFDWLVIWCNF